MPFFCLKGMFFSFFLTVPFMVLFMRKYSAKLIDQVVLVGDATVGKTHLLSRYVKGAPSHNFILKTHCERGTCY